MDSSGVIRRLATFERDRIRDHLLRLGDEDRHLRFGGHATLERIDTHCAGLDLGRVVVVGYMVAGEARGVGELRPLPGAWPRAAEVAISVERPFQGQGVGSALLRRLTLAARNRWIRRIHMLCLLDNGRMVRLARRLDSRLSFDQGQIEASFELPWPTGWTVLEELEREVLRLVAYATWGRLACLRRSPASSARLRRRTERGVTSTSSSSAM